MQKVQTSIIQYNLNTMHCLNDMYENFEEDYKCFIFNDDF